MSILIFGIFGLRWRLKLVFHTHRWWNQDTNEWNWFKRSLSLFVFASVWSDQVHGEHHEGPGSLRCRFPVVPESSAEKYRAGGSAPEPDGGDDPELEEGACLDVCMWESQWGGVMIQDRKWENILGNNILVSPDQSFLGFYRAAPCRRKRMTPQRYCLLGFSLFWEEGGVYSLKEVL